MATHQAIRAVSYGVISLIQSRFRQEGEDAGVTFAVYQSGNFNSEPMDEGISLFLYRVLPNPARRTPTGRLGPDGRRLKTQLPLDLYFLITAWANDASRQHEILGLAMRILEDTPILPTGMLNAVSAGTFQPDETVEIGIAELTNEDILRIWETVTEDKYQISVPYYARNIQIESQMALEDAAPVQERQFELALATQPG